MQDAVWWLSVALFIVWMQRHHRWGLVANALEGNAQLKTRA